LYKLQPIEGYRFRGSIRLLLLVFLAVYDGGGDNVDGRIAIIVA